MKKWFALLGLLATVGVIILLAETPHSLLEAEPSILQVKNQWEPHPLLLPSDVSKYRVRVRQADAARLGMCTIQLDLMSEGQQAGYLLISEQFPAEDKISKVPGQREGESIDAAVERLSKTMSDNTGVKVYEGMRRFKAGDDTGYAYKIHDTHAGSQYESAEFLQKGLHVFLYSDILPQSELVNIAQNFHSY